MRRNFCRPGQWCSRGQPRSLFGDHTRADGDQSGFLELVCGQKLSPEYLLLLFRSMVEKFEESTSGSTYKTIYQGVAAGLQICVAPLEEQRAISAFVFRYAKEIDDLVRRVRESIDRLSEYRAALITAAVTGKLAMDAQPERECEEV